MLCENDSTPSLSSAPGRMVTVRERQCLFFFLLLLFVFAFKLQPEMFL